jgi:excisionase family DNA binding protein
MLTGVRAVSHFRQQLESVPAVRIEQASVMLQFSVRTIYRKIERGQLEALRKRRHCYVTIRSLQRYVELFQYRGTKTFNLRGR